MSLSTAEIERVVRDLAPRLEGGRIERIDQPEPDKLVLTVRKGPELYWLLLCTNPRFSRIHLTTMRPRQGPPAAGFCNAARQHLTRGPIQAFTQRPNDRVVVIESVERDRVMCPHKVTLVAELVGIAGNLLLLDEEDRVLAALTREESERRSVYPGAQYEPPAVPASLPERARADRFADAADPDDPLALSRAIQSYYGALEAEGELAALRTELSRALRSAVIERRRRLANVTRQLERAEQADEWRRKGELLKAALPDIQKGQSEVTLPDLFDPEQPAVTIALDPMLSPAANLEAIFTRYKKARAGRQRLSRREEQVRAQLERVEGIAAQVEAAASPERLRELGEDAQQAGVGPRVRRPARAAAAAEGPRTFRSADGFEILVARNARQNERLTFTLAHGNDYWLHLLGRPGPHVVVRVPSGREVTQDALLDAAHLAVHFSKMRGADRAEVAYARCKNVRRLKAAPAGTVSYADGKTMQVRVEPDRLARLLTGDREEA